ncbi:probable 2-carboxy-D-arabinitol-1-phosphatase isoform X2 [Cryptomeria japonica]|uniref:probable 2-carboxy-D-arabinitol-1-phosphatase isoform X2 n=1 Tax=Cryptomeria japonica TaxID=3369 RepID=UPI0027D9D559|nr:probable 2-carboxy-D-arabinitol-1-phosphatase isoform X2 [Cryptomeria japonica]
MDSFCGLRSSSVCSLYGWTSSFLRAPGKRRRAFFKRIAIAETFGKDIRLKRSSRPCKLRTSVERDSSDTAIRTLNGQVASIENECVSSSPVIQPNENVSLTGGAFDFKGATEPLTSTSLSVKKKVVLVRHGLSSWNAESRIQVVDAHIAAGSQSVYNFLLLEIGATQAKKCCEALSNFKFDGCFASPIARAKLSAEIIWSGREEPLVFLDTLREANLLFLEGMKNVDAQKQYPEIYKAWREDPINFNINGIYPVVKLWSQAKKAWEEILSAPGKDFLVVSHKSTLRALICTALDMTPDRFRAIDINNGGISTFVFNKRGEPMLQGLNLTTHLHIDNVYY